MGEGFVVEFAQTVERRVGVGERLEVGEEPLRRTVSVAVELYAFVDLAGDAFVRHAVGGRERSVVAERAATRTDRTVAVGACEARVYRDLLHATAHDSAEICRVTVVPSVVSPSIHD